MGPLQGRLSLLFCGAMSPAAELLAAPASPAATFREATRNDLLNRLVEERTELLPEAQAVALRAELRAHPEQAEDVLARLDTVARLRPIDDQTMDAILAAAKNALFGD